MAKSDELLRNFQIILPARLVEGKTATAWVGGYVPDPNYDNTISYSDPVFSTSDPILPLSMQVLVKLQQSKLD